MKLDTESGGSREDPNVSALSATLQSLDTDGNTFAILSKSSNDFVQVRRIADRDYEVEYHDPNSDDHFRAGQPLRIDAVQKLFENFRGGGSQWKTMANFQESELKSRSGCAGRSAAMLLVAISLGASVAYIMAP